MSLYSNLTISSGPAMVIATDRVRQFKGKDVCVSVVIKGSRINITFRTEWVKTLPCFSDAEISIRTPKTAKDKGTPSMVVCVQLRENGDHTQGVETEDPVLLGDIEGEADIYLHFECENIYNHYDCTFDFTLYSVEK